MHGKSHAIHCQVYTSNANFKKVTLNYPLNNFSQIRLCHLPCVVFSTKALENQESPEVNTLQVGGKLIISWCCNVTEEFTNVPEPHQKPFSNTLFFDGFFVGARKWGGCIPLSCRANSSEQVKTIFSNQQMFSLLLIRDLRRYNLNTLEKVCICFLNVLPLISLAITGLVPCCWKVQRPAGPWHQGNHC